MNFENINKRMEDNSNFPSDFYKMVNGDNKMRLLTDFVEVNTITKVGGKYGGHLTEKNQPVKTTDPKTSDKVRIQGWAWAIIRNAKDGDEFKIVQFGQNILGQLVALKNNSDYSFAKMPMPYDINISTKNAGTIDVEYTVIPARANTEVSEAEFATLNKKKTIESIVQAIKDKQDGTKTEVTEPATKVDYPAEEINAQDIPF